MKAAVAVPHNSIADLRSAHVDLLKNYREDRNSVEFLDRIEEFLAAVRATGTVLDRERDRVEAQKIMDGWVTRLYRGGRDIQDDVTLTSFDPNRAPELPEESRPFVGLDAFSASESKYFFGREQLIEDSVEHLRTKNLLAIIGPSGSGKSSLVLAGILPRLGQGAIPGSADWLYYPRIVPGSDPLRSLTRVCASGPGVRPEDEQINAFRRSSGELAAALQYSGASRRVMVVDQFEEIFTLCLNTADRDAFESNLAEAVTSTAQNVLILTMRNDYATALPLLPHLHPLIERNTLPPSALSKDELREAILKPAKLAGLKFEDGVVDALISDLVGEAAALPLLQVTLLRLWEVRERNRITLEAYRKVGGGRMALARTADQFYESLLPNEQELARRILCWLVQPGEGMVDVVARRVRRRELYAIEKPAILDPVLNRLAVERLVRITRPDSPEDAEVEIAHEALTRNWARLLDWVQQSRQQITLGRQLERRAEEWVRAGRGLAGLLDAVSLKMFQDWKSSSTEARALGISENAQALLIASETQIKHVAEKERLLKRNLKFAAVLAAVCAILALLFAIEANRKAEKAAQLYNQTVTDKNQLQANAAELKAQKEQSEAKDTELQKNKDRIEEQNGNLRDQVHKNENQQLAADLSSQAGKVANTRPELASLFAIRSIELIREVGLPVPKVTADALAVLSRTPRLVSSLSAHAKVNRAVFSPDGRLLAAAEDDGAVQMWDPMTGKELLPAIRAGSQVYSIAFNWRNDHFATAGPDGVRIWDGNREQIRPMLTAGSAKATDAAFNPDGSLLATSWDDGVLRLWDATGQLTGERKSEAKELHSVAVSPDGEFIAVNGPDGTVYLYSRRADTPLRTFRPLSLSRDISKSNFSGWVAFSQDGASILEEDQTGLLGVWSVQTGLSVRGFSDRLFLDSISDDPDDLFPKRAPPDESRVRIVARSPGNTLLVSIDEANEQHVLQVWNPNPTRSQNWEMDINPVAVAFSPAGAYAVGVGQQEELRKVPDGTLISKWTVPKASDAAVTDEGTVAVAGEAGLYVRVRRGSEEFLLPDSGEVYTKADISVNGAVAAGAAADQVAAWSLRTRELLHRWKLPGVKTVAVNAAGTALAASTGDGIIWLLDIADDTPHQVGKHGDSVLKLRFDPSGSRLASAGSNAHVLVWNLMRPGGVVDLEGADGDIATLAFSSAGDMLAAGSDDSLASWQLPDRAATRQIEPMFSLDLSERSWGAVGLTFTADGKWLRVFDNTGEFRVFQLGLGVDPGLFLRVARGWQEEECKSYLKAEHCPPEVHNMTVLAKANAAARAGDFKAASTGYTKALALGSRLSMHPQVVLKEAAAMMSALNLRQSRESLQMKAETLARAGDLAGSQTALRALVALEDHPDLDPAKQPAVLRLEQFGIQLQAVESNTAVYRVTLDSFLEFARRNWTDLSTAATTILGDSVDRLYRAQPSEANNTVTAVERLDPELKFSATLWNNICWYGTLTGQAAHVSRACERAVTLQPIPEHMDSRAVNRAVRGDTKGAIEDLSFFVATYTASPAQLARRKGYLEALQQDRNPFTPEELGSLINENSIRESAVR
jgi:WD40 repeat protein/energy-coupling factor transporter ATP-binding protein EcfA2